MKEQNLDEDCIAQIERLFADHLYSTNSSVDEEGLIRLDDRELSDSVQSIVSKRWGEVTNENLHTVADLDAYNKEFLQLFGFELNGVDYNADVQIDVTFPSERIIE
jgi:enoyl-[acyl-carrier protein] reductase/trans-2-enoyl-CoA reductase (NAD+)